MATAPKKSTEWQVGDVIDNRYEIVDRIGIGGMGVVWKVHHREWDRELALKMPLSQLVGSLALKERYIREAETWVGLGVHPHIVQCWYVLNIGEKPCLFLDYLTGGSLKDRIEKKTVSPGQWIPIMELAMQIASGLAHAHSRGVVHRDVKPENLLFKDDQTICVTDFGLVKTALPETLDRSTGLSQQKDLGVSGAGAFLGTPQYGAPEQWGAAERVGPAADIYAFGITLYEMCCGRRPFDVEGDTSITLNELLNAHISVKPPDPREFYAEIPEDLVLLSLACLEKDPARRPPSMEAIYQALSAVYQRSTGIVYPSVVALPNSANPDILNNSAVSMLSLEHPDEARQAWRRALRMESAHPESLYNLTRLELQEGRIGTQEALRRLQQAKANYPLALFCIEHGLGKEAVTILSEIATEDKMKKGLTQRALGDALMYTQQYFAAERAYHQALSKMPNDDDSLVRKKVAAQGKRDVGGAFLFPLSVPRATIATGESRLRLAVAQGNVLCVTDSEFVLIAIETEAVLTRLARLQDARPVERIWLHGERVLLQEQGAFQLRRLPDLQLIGRKGGKVLAVAPDLGRLVLLTREGATLYNFEENSFTPIAGADPEPGSHGPHAAFDASGTLLCLLLTTGEVAQLDSQMRAIPMEWPSAFEQPANPTALALGSGGTIYIGYLCGTVNAYDVTTRTHKYSVKLPAPIHGLELVGGDRCLVADLRAIKIALDESGAILWQGAGPAKVEPGGSHLVSFIKGVLHSYRCHPFHLARRWEQTVEAVGLEIADDGGFAASWDREGIITIWELFEKHRVYERSPLLSPGRSYQELVDGASTFPVALHQARQALDKGSLLEAYRELLKARGIMGYGQNPGALDLNWAVIDKMGRDQIDAVWDRLTVGGEKPGPVDISPCGEKLLTTFSSEISLRLETVEASRHLWSHEASKPILVARLEESGALYVDQGGRLVRLALHDGRATRELPIGVGTLVDAHLQDGVILLATSSGVGRYDLHKEKLTVPVVALDKPPARIFPWYGSQVIVVSGDGECGVVDLGKKPSGALQPFHAKAYRPEATVTFAFHDTKNRVIVLGSEDGTLAITDAANGRLLYAVGKVSGAVTGFALLTELCVGVVATARGQLYFWDLLADKVLDGLLAHRGGIVDLRADATGRHLITSGKDNQTRLWETSWTASLSLEEKPKLDWLPSGSALLNLARRFGLGSSR